MNTSFTAGFRHFALLEPAAPGIVAADGSALSRGQLFEASNRLSRALRAFGLQPGDTVAVIAPNCIEYVLAYLAATQIGLYFVSINPRLAPAEVAYILTDCGANVLFAHERFRTSLADALAAVPSPPRQLVSFGNIAGFTELEQLTAAHSGEPLDDPLTGRLLIYTSATTGRPKGVELPLQDAQTVLDRVLRTHVANGIPLANGNVHLCASMLYHPAPLEWAVQALHLGHQVVLMDQWEPESLLRMIDSHAVTTSFMVPAMFIRMLKLPAQVRRRYRLSSLRFVMHGAAPCPIEVKRQMLEWWGPVIWESYAASEGGGTIVDSEHWLEHPGTVGRPFPGTRLKILDEQGEAVAAGVAGTVYMTRYTGDRFRYRGDADKTRSAYDGDFFTVGDIGYLDEQGYLFLCDRRIDMIISGGMNIYSAEIEKILVQHPKVLDCAVFGVPDELMGEAVKAVIQPSSQHEAGPTLTAEILDFLGERLGPAKLPRRIEYQPTLPRDPNGKIYKRLLRDPHWEGLRRRI